MRLLGKMLFPDLPPWEQTRYGRMVLVILTVVGLLSVGVALVVRYRAAH